MLFWSTFSVYGLPSLTVSENINVKPSSSELDDPVTAVLSCTGSETVSYYISNPVTWSFIDHLGNVQQLSRSFYSQSPEHDIEFTEDPISFKLIIKNVKNADDGIYQCAQTDVSTNILFSKNVSLTVLRPVEQVELEMYDLEYNLLGKANSTLEPSALAVVPGDYIVQCTASGSNPTPSISFNVVDSRSAIFSNTSWVFDAVEQRLKYTGIEMRTIGISAEPSEQSIVCKANIIGEAYPQKSARISLVVEPPRISCASTLDIRGYVHFISCNVSAVHQLDCRKVMWEANGKEIILEEERAKGEVQNDTILACNAINDVLEVTYAGSHMAKEYSVVYGTGKLAHRRTINGFHGQGQGQEEDVPDSPSGCKSFVSASNVFLLLCIACLGSELRL